MNRASATELRLPPKWMLLAEAIFFDLIGIWAIVLPMVASIALEQIFGVLFVFAGVFVIGNSIWNKGVSHRVSAIFSGGIMVIAGLLLLLFVQQSLQLLTWIVGAAFAIEGVLQILAGVSHRGRLRMWGMLVLSGIVAVVLATLILMQWPSSSQWTLGILFGVNFCFLGATLFALAFSVPTKEQPKAGV